MATTTISATEAVVTAASMQAPLQNTSSTSPPNGITGGYPGDNRTILRYGPLNLSCAMPRSQ